MQGLARNNQTRSLLGLSGLDEGVVDGDNVPAIIGHKTLRRPRALGPYLSRSDRRLLEEPLVGHVRLEDVLLEPRVTIFPEHAFLTLEVGAGMFEERLEDGADGALVGARLLGLVNVAYEAEDQDVVGVEGFDANRVGLVPDHQRHSASPRSLAGARPFFGL